MSYFPLKRARAFGCSTLSFCEREPQLLFPHFGGGETGAFVPKSGLERPRLHSKAFVAKAGVRAQSVYRRFNLKAILDFVIKTGLDRPKVHTKGLCSKDQGPNQRVYFIGGQV